MCRDPAFEALCASSFPGGLVSKAVLILHACPGAFLAASCDFGEGRCLPGACLPAPRAWRGPAGHSALHYQCKASCIHLQIHISLHMQVRHSQHVNNSWHRGLSECRIRKKLQSNLQTANPGVRRALESIGSEKWVDGSEKWVDAARAESGIGQGFQRADACVDLFFLYSSLFLFYFSRVESLKSLGDGVFVKFVCFWNPPHLSSISLVLVFPRTVLWAVLKPTVRSAKLIEC